MKKLISRAVIIPVLLPFSFAAFAGNLYVSPNGNDGAAGTLNAPYKTINKAANVARAGDTVFIREGTYEETLRPANSGTASNPIVFQSYQNEKVIITAMQAVNGWSVDSGAVYKTNVNWTLGQENFVMNGATALDLARWPNNTDGDPFTLNSKRSTGGSGGNVGAGAYINHAPGIPNIDWSNGGSVFFYGDKPGGGWLAWREFITGSNRTRVNIDLSKKNPTWIRTAHAPADGGEFFLQGVRGALDYQNEWYYNPTSQTLFVQLPNDAAPRNGQVKMRRRLKTVDLANRSFIEIRNLAVFGGSIEMTGRSNNNKIYGVSSFYGNATLGVHRNFAAPSYSINITGSNNIVERSEIGFGSGSGYRDAGTNNKLLDSNVHNHNVLGDYNGVILLRDGKNSLVKNNTLTRSGRATIQANNRDAEYAYNDISFANLVADDAGLFYTTGGPQRVTIHHNWFHDAYSHGSKDKACGIYLDNDSHSFTVHNNVIWNTEWTGIQINWNGINIDVFNNTFWNNSATMGAWHKEGTRFSDVRVWNNLSDGNEWEPQSNKQNNLTASGNPFVNSAGGDFKLRSGTSPVNGGRQIAGVTDGFVGSAPDIGAYELGGNAWVAGVTWDKASGPADRCYNLPGESCSAIPSIITVPAKIQSEDYNSFSDTTAGNTGGQYRSDNVDIGATTDTGGGHFVGWTAAGEWLEYDIDVSIPGEYEIETRVASQPGGGSFNFQVDGVSVGSTTNVAATGGWQTYTTLKANIGQLSAGIHTVRFNIAAAGININWLDFKVVTPAPTPTPVPTSTPVPNGINLVKNAGFETGNLNQWGGWGASRTVGNDSASGSYSARVQGAGAISQIITGLTPNTTYVYTAKAKVNSGSSANFGVKDYGSNEKANNVTSTSYTTQTLTFTTGTNNTQAQIYFYMPSAGDVGFIDEISLVVEGTTAPPPNLLSNSGFETGNLNDWQGWGASRTANANSSAGSFAARVQGTGAISQIVKGLTPNTTYVYTAQVKVNSGDSANFGVKDYGGTEKANSVTGTSYASQSLSFTTGANNTQAQIYLYMSSAGDVGFIDEASVVEQR